MPSFDVVSEVDQHELSNGINQAIREVTTRFDFKGTGSNFELNDNVITMNTESDFQLTQMYDILCNKLVKRGIDIACLEKGEPVIQARSLTLPGSADMAFDPVSRAVTIRVAATLSDRFFM